MTDSRRDAVPPAEACDIWFGPGGLRGVFGAGVALGLAQLQQQGELSLRHVRLVGASVGCLNAVYLATGHARCGLEIYAHDIDRLVCARHLLPSIRLRLANRLRRLARPGSAAWPVPSVLDVDHVFRVMARRTPRIVDELRQAEADVLAETWDIAASAFRHVSLQRAEDPLAAIRAALNYFPFHYAAAQDQLDSAMGGFGFAHLLRLPARHRLLVVLNEHPRQRRLRRFAADLGCAVLAASPRVSLLFLLRSVRKNRVIRQLPAHGPPVRLVFPAVGVRRARMEEFRRVHEQGRQAAQDVLGFVQAGSLRVAHPQASPAGGTPA